MVGLLRDNLDFAVGANHAGSGESENDNGLGVHLEELET